MDESSEPSPPAPAPRVSLTKSAGPAARPALRASDADRDRIAEILREALAEGRLTAEEHTERVGAVYAARTHEELEPLVGDLPAGRPAAAGPASARPYDAVLYKRQVFGGAARKGRWRVPPRTNAFALFGGVEIDLTEALFEHPQVVINACALFGGVEIRVPENVSVRCAGTGVFGGFDVKSAEAADPDAPVVVVTGFAVFGGVEAKPRRGKRLKNLRPFN